MRKLILALIEVFAWALAGALITDWAMEFCRKKRRRQELKYDAKAGVDANFVN